MGDFCPIVFVLSRPMDHGREDVLMCSRITPKLVGEQLPGCLSLMFEGPTKEALGASSLRDENLCIIRPQVSVPIVQRWVPISQ